MSKKVFQSMDGNQAAAHCAYPGFFRTITNSHTAS